MFSRFFLLGLSSRLAANAAPFLCRKIPMTGSYALKKMIKKNGKIRFHRAMTLLELVLAMVMITIIFAAVLPQFAAIRNSWDSKQGASEALQNGRVLMDHISRNLSEAKRITVVSASTVTNGYIQFVDNNDVNDRYDIASSNSYVEYGAVGSLSDLAGPVNSFKFTCYDACDLSMPITDGNDIRVIKVDATFTNSASMGQDKTFTTWVYLRTNSQNQVCWSDEDIGSVAATGSAAFSSSSDTWTVIGSGADIWDTTDEFHYVYQTLSGDGQIVARVGSITNTNSWAKAGVMIRETLTGGSRHAMMVVTPGNGTAFQRRTSTSGSSTHTAGSSVTAPYWVKLARRSNTLTGYESANGSTWTQVGTDTVTMATDVYIGLCVTSHSDGALCTADFNNVSFLTYGDFNEAKGAGVTSISISKPSTTNTGDLLIAAVATEGSTTFSTPSGWTLINQGSYNSAITLGSWYKIATASESSSYTFSWTGSEQAYGWIMRFTGCDATNPISASATNETTSSTPTSPAVTSTADCSLILRLGAFNSGSISVDSPGLSGHSPITMDSSTGTVAILGSWTTGTTHSKVTGTDRALVLVAHAKGSSGSSSLTAVTYGGRSMTKIVDKLTGSSFNWVYVAAFILNDANIEAATSTTFAPTWSSTPSNITYSSVFLQNVNQTTSVGASASNGATSSSLVSTSSLATSNGDMVIEAAASSNTGTYSVTTGWTKALEFSAGGGGGGPGGGGPGGGGPSSYGGMGGYEAASGTSVTPSITQSNGDHSLIGFVVQSSGDVSGGAGYVKQATAGSSGTSNFILSESKDARLLTIAIAPDSTKDSACCGNEIRP